MAKQVQGEPSIIPDFEPDAPIIADIREYIPDAAQRIKFVKLCQSSVDYGKAKREAETLRKPVTVVLKEMCEKYQINRASANGPIINYYSQVRTRVSREKLIQAGVPVKIVNACTETSTSPTLKVYMPEERDDE